MPPPLSETASDTLDRISSFVSGLFTPTLRLGVTGLSRSGKTVFVTSLVRNLVAGGRLPFFAPVAEGRILEAHLEPQPDDQLPRFNYEAHIQALTQARPEWPEGTRRISELRLVISYRPDSALRRALGVKKLHLDLIDYPGEWLIDLSMLDQSYAEWSAESIDLARDKRHRQAAGAWLDFQRDVDPYAREDEDLALTGAELFRDYLAAARAIPNALSTLGPGRFLMPGDLEDSPLLTFFPLDLRGLGASPRGSLATMMARRYESYRSHVVRPFFRHHFSRIDRQIVLIDVLAALNAGPDAVTDLQVALDQVLRAFRPGANSWLAAITGRRTDRILFAATKADHLPQSSYDRLEAILRLMTERATKRAKGAGADVRVLALAALRATREGEVKDGTNQLPCIIGVPMAGEKIEGKVFNGKKEAAIFPGDLPDDPEHALATSAKWAKTHKAMFVRFCPPKAPRSETQTLQFAMPHIRLDRALDFLIGDWLA